MDRKTDYALRAAVYLARHYCRDHTATTAEIAEDSGAPRKYLAHILLALKNHALVGSTPGRGGGYRLMRRPELISVAEIIDAVADDKEAVRGGREHASAAIYRLARDIVNSGLRTAVHDAMSKISLAELVSSAQEKAR